MGRRGRTSGKCGKTEVLLSVTDRYLLLVTDTSRAGRSGLERLRVEGQRDGPVPRIFRPGFKGRGCRVPNVSSPRVVGGCKVLQCNKALFVKDLCLFRCYRSVTKV